MEKEYKGSLLEWAETHAVSGYRQAIEVLELIKQNQELQAKVNLYETLVPPIQHTTSV